MVGGEYREADVGRAQLTEEAGRRGLWKTFTGNNCNGDQAGVALPPQVGAAKGGRMGGLWPQVGKWIVRRWIRDCGGGFRSF